MILWALIGTLFMYPPLVELVLPIFAMQDAMLATVVVGLIVAFFLVYHTYQQVTKIEMKVTELVQNVAIHNYVKEVVDNPEEKDGE